MTNRYVIDGLLTDLVFRKKDIIIVGVNHHVVEQNIFMRVADEIQGNTLAWGYRIERITRESTKCRIETRAHNILAVARADPRKIEGRRADVWVIYRRHDWNQNTVPGVLRAIRREAQRNNAEIIEIN